MSARATRCPTAFGSVRRALLIGTVWCFPVVAASAAAADETGQRLFNGQIVLSGRLAGHAEALPAQAVRCSNCHSTRPSSDGARRADARAAAGSRVQAGTAALPGPILNARTLLEPTARRNGPASTFDSAALCRLLREGVDPAHITLVPVMPRYELSDTQCTALWAYLIRTGS